LISFPAAGPASPCANIGPMFSDLAEDVFSRTLSPFAICVGQRGKVEAKAGKIKMQQPPLSQGLCRELRFLRPQEAVLFWLFRRLDKLCPVPSSPVEVFLTPLW